MNGGVPCHFVRRVVVSPFILMVLILEAVSRCAFTGFCGSGLPREDRPVEKGGTHGRGVKSTATGFLGPISIEHARIVFVLCVVCVMSVVSVDRLKPWPFRNVEWSCVLR